MEQVQFTTKVHFSTSLPLFLTANWRMVQPLLLFPTDESNKTVLSAQTVGLTFEKEERAGHPVTWMGGAGGGTNTNATTCYAGGRRRRTCRGTPSTAPLNGTFPRHQSTEITARITQCYRRGALLVTVVFVALLWCVPCLPV